MYHLTDRASLILKQLIEYYLQDGQPVSSKILADLSPIPMSSATVRNSMAELEQMGLILAPHRSAGRIPTAQGLRYFVDHLLTPALPQQDLWYQAEQTLQPFQATNDLLKSASTLLSKLTSWVGVVTVPKTEHLILRHIEFLPLSGNQVLAILVVNDKDVQNRILLTQGTYSASQLQHAANFLNEHFRGQDLKHAQKLLLDALKADEQQMNGLLKAAVEMASLTLASDTPPQEDIVVSGEHHLLTQVEVNSVDELQRWAATFCEKQHILHLLNECVLSDGIQIFIGEKAGHDTLAQCSLIAMRYHLHGKPVGVLGVMGPTRMQYNQVVPLVDMTAKLLSSALKSSQESP